MKRSIFRIAATQMLPFLLLCFLSALPVEAARDKAAEKAASLKGWVDGPIRYIIDKQEMQQFRRLRTEEDRALFIDRFWKRRDPNPQSYTNAYRQLFWERVAFTNERFLDSSRPGWMTDRGKIHILYGAPDDIQDVLDLQVEDGTGVIRWLYEGRPGQRQDLDPLVIVPFVRDGGGEYKVSYDPKLSSPFFQPNLVREGWNDDYDNWLERFGAPTRSRLSVMLDLGKMQEVPPEAQVLLERVETLEAFRTDLLPVLVQRLRPPEKDGTMVIVSADLGAAQADSIPTLVARFQPAGRPEATPRVLDEGSFKIVEHGSTRLAQGRIVLEPGDYELTMMAAEPARRRTGMYRAIIEVPDRARTMQLSDVLLVQQLESVPYRSLVTYDEPFYLGPYRALPRMDSRVQAGEPVQLVYEVYEGESPYEIRYQLEGQDLDLSWRSLGPPSADRREGLAHAWELATSARWPAGNYRIRIDVQDASGKLVSRLVPFELVATN